jgi:hypothetical protein
MRGFCSGVIEPELVDLVPQGLDRPFGRGLPSRSVKFPGADRVGRDLQPSRHGRLREDRRDKLGPLLADLTDSTHGSQLKHRWGKLRDHIIAHFPLICAIVAPVIGSQLVGGRADKPTCGAAETPLIAVMREQQRRRRRVEPGERRESDRTGGYRTGTALWMWRPMR